MSLTTRSYINSQKSNRNNPKPTNQLSSVILNKPFESVQSVFKKMVQSPTKYMIQSPLKKSKFNNNIKKSNVLDFHQLLNLSLQRQLQEQNKQKQSEIFCLKFQSNIKNQDNNKKYLNQLLDRFIEKQLNKNNMKINSNSNSNSNNNNNNQKCFYIVNKNEKKGIGLKDNIQNNDNSNNIQKEMIKLQINNNNYQKNHKKNIIVSKSNDNSKHMNKSFDNSEQNDNKNKNTNKRQSYHQQEQKYYSTQQQYLNQQISNPKASTFKPKGKLYHDNNQIQQNNFIHNSQHQLTSKTASSHHFNKNNKKEYHCHSIDLTNMKQMNNKNKNKNSFSSNFQFRKSNVLKEKLLKLFQIRRKNRENNNIQRQRNKNNGYSTQRYHKQDNQNKHNYNKLMRSTSFNHSYHDSNKNQSSFVQQYNNTFNITSNKLYHRHRKSVDLTRSKATFSPMKNRINQNIINMKKNSKNMFIEPWNSQGQDVKNPEQNIDGDNKDFVNHSDIDNFF